MGPASHAYIPSTKNCVPKSAKNRASSKDAPARPSSSIAHGTKDTATPLSAEPMKNNGERMNQALARSMKTEPSPPLGPTSLLACIRTSTPETRVGHRFTPPRNARNLPAAQLPPIPVGRRLPNSVSIVQSKRPEEAGKSCEPAVNGPSPGGSPSPDRPWGDGVVDPLALGRSA